MKSRYFSESESLIKRFVKKSKQISYSTALLVTFLITGFVSYANTDENIMTRVELSERLAEKKDDIDNKLRLSKEELKKLNLQIEQLLRRGIFWVKPLDYSYQFFFNGTWENVTENKDKTIKNFSHPEYGLHGEYNEYLDRLAVSGHDKDIVHSGRYLGTLGIMKKNLSFTDFIDFGANIQPKDVDERELKVPEVAAKNVAMVEFTPPKTPHIHIEAPGTDIPVIAVLATPTTPSVAITEPEKITKLEPIEISKIEEIEIDIPVPATVTPGKVEAPEISEPSAPKGFTPKFISAPDIPSAPAIVSPTVKEVKIVTGSSGNGDNSWIWKPSGDNGLISQVIMDSANWDIKVHTGGERAKYDTKITDYTAKLPKGYSGTPESVTDATYEETEIGNGKIGIYRVIGAPYSNLGKDTVVNINAEGRTTTEQYRQFVHYDPHGDRAVKRKDGKIDATSDNFDGATQPELDELIRLSKYEVLKNIGNMDMVFSMLGEVNLKGNTINIVGMQGHNCWEDSRHPNSYVLHSGKINIEGENNIGLAFTTDIQREHRNAFISNYGDGEINIKGNKNYAIVFDRDDTDIHSLTFYNGGKIKLNGKENVGVLINRMPNGGSLDLEKPITIVDGEKNIGVFHGDGKNPHINPDLSNIKVDILKGNENIALVELNDQTVNSVKLNIESGDKNILVYPKKDKTVIAKSGILSIMDGRENMAMVVKEGNVDFSGVTAKMGEKATKSYIALVEGSGKEAKIGKVESENAKNSILLFAKDSGKITVNASDVKLQSDENISKANGDSLAYAIAVGSGTEINIKADTKPETPNIVITGGKFSDATGTNVGFAMMAQEGAVINADNNNIKVVGGEQERDQ